MSTKNDKIKFDNALEVGCGSGYMSNQINKLENIKKIHLIDISKKMISKAKENLLWKPTINLDKGIKYTIDWFKKTYF